jgi:hypothetical protein
MTPLELLLRIQSRDSTGQLFVVTFDGRQIRIGIDQGRIVHVGYGPRRGLAAAELASKAVAKSATFRPDPDVLRDDDLPAERNLLGLLSRMLSGSNADAVNALVSDSLEGESTHSGATVTNAPPALGQEVYAEVARPRLETRELTRSASPIPAAQVARIKTILIEYVGPIAGLLVDEKIAAGTLTIDALVERLAPEIGDVKDAQAFREKVERLK